MQAIIKIIASGFSTKVIRSVCGEATVRAGVILVDITNGKILTIRNYQYADWPQKTKRTIGKITFPGGTIDYNADKTLDDTIKREILEELYIELADSDEFPWHYAYRLNRDGSLRDLAFYKIIPVNSLDVRFNKEEIAGIEWVKFGHLVNSTGATYLTSKFVQWLAGNGGPIITYKGRCIFSSPAA